MRLRKSVRHLFLRLAAPAAVGALVAAGCGVPHGGLYEGAEFTCEATVCNDEGHVERVSLSDVEFGGRRVYDFCESHPGEETMWRAHLQEVLGDPTFREHPGPWHARDVSCTLTAGFVDGPPPCPVLGAELIDDCADGVGCVVAAPEPRDFAPTFLSEASAVESVSYENTCSESQFVRADTTVFDDPFRQFAVVANGCGAAADPRGFELTPAGTPGDGCTVDFQFTPKDVGEQTASYRVPVEGSDMIETTLRGEGGGAAPRTIDGVVRYCIEPGAADCGVASFGVVSDGPAGFRITAFDYEIIDGTGFTEPPVGPEIDALFAPGAAAVYQVEWCRSASSLAGERLQLSLSTTSATLGATRDFRFTIDAPAACP